MSNICLFFLNVFLAHSVRAPEPFRCFLNWAVNFMKSNTAVKCQIVFSECELKGVKTLMVNGEWSFEASLQLDNMSSPALTGTIGFSAWDPDTARRWQADNSTNFSRLGLWMALYDRLVECDWWPRLNNGTLPPPYKAQKHWNPSWHTELLPIARQCKRKPLEETTCT